MVKSIGRRAGSRSVEELEASLIRAGLIQSEPATVRLTNTNGQSFADSTLTKIEWDTASELNAEAGTLADLANNQVVIPSSDYSVARYKIQVSMKSTITLDTLDGQLNGSSPKGRGIIVEDGNSDRKQVTSGWFGVSEGDSITSRLKQTSGGSVDFITGAGNTWMEVEVR